MPRWLFSKLGADRSRSGGDPAAHAFDHSVETFVREVVQNANDQALSGGAEVVFRFRDLQGDDLASFLAALDWERLRTHLDAVARSSDERAVTDTLDRLDDGRLLVLTIEDRGTIGLTGDEVEDDSHFCALCRDKLFSHKQDVSAGGSYGLGKSVLWTFSGLACVLFLSNLSEEPDEADNPRLIGRTELPYHRVQTHERSYSGSGWFGRVVEDEVYQGKRADSVWGHEASRISQELRLSHAHTSGTSIMVVGFRDPEADGDPSVDAFSKRIGESAARNFWPALYRESKPLQVLVDKDGQERAAGERHASDLLPFIECFRRRHEASDTLSEPGDVARRDIRINLPKTRSGKASVEGLVTLLVRLAHPGETSALDEHVAMFRGPGMVVKYWNQRRLTLSSRPFHALLIGGTARDFEEGREHDEHVETFLRYAEPPGHDYWDSTPKLKDHYLQGYKKALDQMKSRVREALKDLVEPAISQGRRGPDRLRRRFPLGTPGDISPGRGESPFNFKNVTGQLAMGRWDFEGRIVPATRKHGGWRARVQLLHVGEDGKVQRDAPIAIEELEVQTDGATCEVEGGYAHIRADSRVGGVDFIGWSGRVAERFESRLLSLGEIELRVVGELLPEGVQ